MRQVVLASILAAVFAGPAHAQLGTTRLDHDVQKLWDDTFNPGPRGDERTNWERRREADRRDWCRVNTGDPRCVRYR